ncbi:MAG: YdcF family protein [bacterium]|nr:YdcF family protein [bacterium]
MEMNTVKGLIVVLGSPNTNQGDLLSIAKERCELALAEYESNPGYKILLTGGHGSHFNTTDKPHVTYLKKHLLSRGIPEEDFVESAESSNTREDASLSKPIIMTYKVRHIVVITSDYHIDRAQSVFEREFTGTHVRVTFSASRTDEALCTLDLEEIKRHEREALAKLKT